MSIGIRNALLNEVLGAFYLHFTSGGRVLWVTEDNDPILASRQVLSELGVSLLRPRSLPSVVIYFTQRGLLVLIDVAELRGLMTSKRREALMKVFGGCRVELIFVSAFRSRSEFQESLTEPPWGTVVWFADEPDHLVYFNDGSLLGRTKDL